jgi:glycosyltransferase involved in cell wall biosynthesis
MSENDKVKLSVFIITYNEENNIGRCLRSVKDLADEIIVVDSYSDDRTEEICKSFGAVFIQNPFEGYIEQYQFALEKTSFDYVLNLDADEALSDELQKNIAAVIENWRADGYKFNRLSNYCGKWIRYGAWYPDRKMRLWKKEGSHIGGANPHHRIILPNDAQIKFIKGDLLHYTFNNQEEHIHQINRFSGISAKTDYERGKTSSLLKILVKPAFKFFRDYILRLGFLDGYQGYLIAKNSAFGKYLRMVKLKEIESEV